MGRLSWATWLYIVAIVLAAAAILSRIPFNSADRQFWVTCAALALLFLVCDSSPIVLGDRQWAWSPSSAATLAAVLLLGQNGAIGAAMVGAVAVISVRRKLRLVERLFNGAMYTVAGYAAGTTFLVLERYFSNYHPHGDFIHIGSFTEILQGLEPGARVSATFEMAF